jgi:hypothetical protein
MVKVTRPIMSQAASGSLADAVTVSKWKGRPYVRTHVKPTDPKSGAQLGRRAMFSFLSLEWPLFTEAQKVCWEALANELDVGTGNAYLHFNLKRWHNFLPPTRDPTLIGLGWVGIWDSNPSAVWEQNHIKLTCKLAAKNQNWGVAIFASPTPGFTTEIAIAILLKPLMDTISHNWFWTPPAKATWYFNTRLFAKCAVLGAEGTEYDSGPP